MAPSKLPTNHVRSARRTALHSLAACALLGLAAPSGAQMILETYNPSLTTYLPIGYTPAQDIRPQPQQRGVGLDGAARAGSTLGWALAGNPFEPGAGGAASGRVGDVRLDTGTYAPTEVDLALPSIGPRWVIGRTYNGRQDGGGGAYADSDGPQGTNWFQTSMPEVREYDTTGTSSDTVYLIYGADRYIEFKYVEAGLFKAVNGAAGIMKKSHHEGTCGEGIEEFAYVLDLWTYYDQAGNTAVFMKTFSGDCRLWKLTDAAGNTAYVGGSDFCSAFSGYDGNRILTAYDATNRRYSYTYTTIDGVVRLTRVLAETDADNNWTNGVSATEVGRVDYAYYQTGDNTNGPSGNLKLVTVTTPLSAGSSASLVRKQHYRYYTSTGAGTYTNGIKLVVDAEGCRNYDWSVDSALDDDFLTASDGAIEPYASLKLTYDGSRRITDVTFNGQCGCGGGASGLHTLTYGSNGSFSPTSGYDTAWSTRTVVAQPDGAYLTQYFDELGQPLSRAVTGADPATAPASLWLTEVIRDSGGRVTEVRSPAANTAYDHDKIGVPDGTVAASASVGLITEYERETSGDLTGFVLDRKWKVGTGGTEYLDGSTTYTSRTLSVGGSGVVRPLVASRREYTQAVTSGTTGSNLTSLAYAYHSATSTNVQYIAVKSITTTHPAVDDDKNGSNSATTSYRYFTADGRPSFSKAPDGVISYTGYDAATGVPVKSIQDADMTQTGTGQDFDGVTNPDGGVLTNTGSGTPFHNKTTFAHDAQGRVDTTTLPSGRVQAVYYNKIADGRLVTLSSPKYVSGTGRYYGPASYTLSNHAGKTEVQAVLSFATADSDGTLYTTTGPSGWVYDVTGGMTPTADDNPYDAVHHGTIERLSTTVHDGPGTRVAASRTFHTLGWPGTDTANYDETTFAYDSLGRRWRVKTPPGDITRTVFDTLGRPTAQWAGTNDNSFSGGEVSGSDNMTKVSTSEYDSGSSGGNSYLTKRTLDADGNWVTTTDQRVTTYINDDHGRAVVTVNPTAPHALAEFDNLGRVVAVAQYSSSSGLDAADLASSLATNRVTLSKTFYDERGQVWKTARHKIDQADGSDDDNITSNNWYDPAGRRVKVRGEEFSKTRYDRLGRPTHVFTLAQDNDAANTYTDVYASGTTAVAGETVLEEHQTVYEATTGNSLISVAILRHPNGSTPAGALDSNADAVAATLTAANVYGRVQIHSMWYDGLDRMASTVNYGTNLIVGDGSTSTGTFTRAGSAPTRSATELRTDYAYAGDGQVKDVIDPKSTVQRTERDVAGRITKTIANYGDGVPSGADSDQTVVYTYSKGLRTRYTADLPSGQTDQVTKYIYGVSAGDANKASQIASNSLLRAVVYPDSANAATTPAGINSSDDDVVSQAYNAQGQVVWGKDQAGNVAEQDYDLAGRLTQRRFTTIVTADGFNDLIKRVSLSYHDRGQVKEVKQHDHATVGSGTVKDEVEYAYDNWGNLSSITQDPDSEIGAASGRDEFAVSFSHSKSAPSDGRQSVRRTGTDYGNFYAVGYSYLSTVYNKASLVQLVTAGGVGTVAEYAYMGAHHTARTNLNEPDVFQQEYVTATAGSYPDLDRFNRPVQSRWTKNLATDRDFYDVDVAYDEASNITSTVDNIYKDAGGVRAFDTMYILDGLYRVTRAEQGSFNGTSITTRNRDEQWLDSGGVNMLSHTGNWEQYRLDLNGNNNFSDTVNGEPELDQTRDHNDVNEITDVSGYAADPAYDDAGNLTDDGNAYTHVYDAMHRLVKTKTRAGVTVAEYRYNGLGHRTGWHSDTDADGTVEANADDPWYWFCYDDRWRVAMTYRGTDADPKEVFVYHAAGLSGGGGASYIDAVILRERDVTNGWGGAADGDFEQKHYYCQNWRADVVALVRSDGWQAEQARYAAYGTPFCLPAGDTDADGDCDGTDSAKIGGWWGAGAGAYDVRGDLDLDGDVDFTDTAQSATATFQASGGRGVLSKMTVGSRKGYAGYENAGVVPKLWHVRHRVLDSALGRWTTRDPIGYVGDLNLMAYVVGRAVQLRDPTGLWPPFLTPPPSPPPPIVVPAPPAVPVSPPPLAPPATLPTPAPTPAPTTTPVPTTVPNVTPAPSDPVEEGFWRVCWRVVSSGLSTTCARCCSAAGFILCNPTPCGTGDMLPWDYHLPKPWENVPIKDWLNPPSTDIPIPEPQNRRVPDNCQAKYDDCLMSWLANRPNRCWLCYRRCRLTGFWPPSLNIFETCDFLDSEI